MAKPLAASRPRSRYFAPADHADPKTSLAAVELELAQYYSKFVVESLLVGEGQFVRRFLAAPGKFATETDRRNSLDVDRTCWFLVPREPQIRRNTRGFL
jgi:hypothetical protein